MATAHPRIQVTVDPELAEALASVPTEPKSRSRQIRDLALRGAEAEREDLKRREWAKNYLKGIANGTIDFDFEAAREIWEERERSV